MDKEYIERESMLEEITAIMFGKPDIDLARAAVKYATAADVVEVRHGEWREHIRVSKEGKPLLRHYQCNLCGVYLATQANFCPNCGAKMDDERKEQT